MSDHEFDEPKVGYHTQSAANLTAADIERKNKLFSNLVDGVGTRDRDVLCESVMLYSPDGKTELIKEARVQFVYGRKYGLVGRNGIGKSTLLRAVSNYALAGFPQHLRVVYVEQEEIEGDQRPCMQFVVESDEENNWLHAEQQRLYDVLENGDDDDDTFDADAIQLKLDKIDERMDEIDSRRIESRATSILTGLGFTPEMQQKPVTELSGGWRRRVAMACALLVFPDIMLLDEPTNHLDFAAVAWLQAYLKTVQCTMVIVSHDRDFINAISTDCIWLHHKKLDYFRGDYDSFIKVRDEQNKAQRHQYDVQQKKIADAKEFINEAKTSGNPDMQRLAVTKQKMLDKLMKEELIAEPDDDKEFRFTFPKPGKLDHALLECKDLDFAYNVDPDTVEDDTPMLLKNITVNLTMESRVASLGHNGAGKTTLIKLIMGRQKPVRGLCRFNDHARAAFFTQHHVDQLNLEMSALEYIQSVHTDAKEYQIRGILGRFGFDAQLAGQKIATLSGGQKSRVAFALLTWKEPHLIIMDEPTNHLDIETIEALINAVKQFQGAVVVISHDTHFIGEVANEFWALSEEGELRTLFDLDEAKEFAYKPIQFDPDDVSLKRVVKAKPDTSVNSAAAPTKQFVRNKNKSKKGKGGIDVLADEKAAAAAEKDATDRAQAAAAEAERKEIEQAEVEASKMEQSVKQKSKATDKSTKQQANVASSFALLSLEAEEGLDSDDEKEMKKRKKKQAAMLAEAAAQVDADEAEAKRKRKEKKKLKAMLADQGDEKIIDVNDLPDGNDDNDDVVKPKSSKSKSKKVDFAGDDAVEADDIDISLEKPKKSKSKSKSKADDDDDNAEVVKPKKSKKVVVDDDVDDDEQKEVTTKKKKKSKSKSADDDDDDTTVKSKASRTVDSDDEPAAKPKKSKSKSKSKAEDDDETEDKPKKSKSKSKSKQADDDEGDAPVKSKSSRTVDSDDDAAVAKKKKSKSKDKKSRADDIEND